MKKFKSIVLFATLFICFSCHPLVSVNIIVGDEKYTISLNDLSNFDISSTSIEDSKIEILRRYIKDNSTSFFNDRIYILEKKENEYTYKYQYDYTLNDGLFSLLVEKKYDEDSLSIEVDFNLEEGEYIYEARCQYDFDTNQTSGCTYYLDKNFDLNFVLSNPFNKYSSKIDSKSSFQFILDNSVSLIDNLFKKFNKDIEFLNISLLDFGLVNY